jgi:hypothetical protein
MGDIGTLVSQVASDSLIVKKDNLFIVPSISASVWTPEQIWNTGIVGTYTSSLYGLAVERFVYILLSLRLSCPHTLYPLFSYPDNNCAAMYGSGNPINPQDVFPSYLNHSASTLATSTQANSPWLVTNPRSCSRQIQLLVLAFQVSVTHLVWRYEALIGPSQWHLIIYRPPSSTSVDRTRTITHSLHLPPTNRPTDSGPLVRFITPRSSWPKRSALAMRPRLLTSPRTRLRQYT